MAGTGAAEATKLRLLPSLNLELLDEWPDLDPGTARLIRAAVSSRSRPQMQLAFEMLNARAGLARAVP
jgi:hypothetical protein